MSRVDENRLKDLAKLLKDYLTPPLIIFIRKTLLT